MCMTPSALRLLLLALIKAIDTFVLLHARRLPPQASTMARRVTWIVISLSLCSISAQGRVNHDDSPATRIATIADDDMIVR